VSASFLYSGVDNVSDGHDFYGFFVCYA